MIASLVGAATLMAPESQEGVRPFNYAITRALRSEPGFLIARSACASAQESPAPGFSGFRQGDPRNGLYAWLEVLGRLRQSATAPEVLSAVAAATQAPPARLYQERAFTLSRNAVCGVKGLAPGSPDLQADRLALGTAFMGGPHRVVLRELAQRLVSDTTAWSPDQRSLAAGGVFRLFSDLLADSPTPDITMLAAECLPPALPLRAGLVQTALAGNLTPEALTERCTLLAQRWKEAGRLHGGNLMPWTGDVALAIPTQDRFLRALTAAGIAGAAWAVVFIACLLTLPSAIRARGLEPAPAWNFGLAAPWIVAAPAILGVLTVLLAPLPMRWLLSGPSATAAAFLPVLFLAPIGLATRWTVRENAPLSQRVVLVLVALPIACFVLGLLILPLHREPWRPPLVVQLFRKPGTFFALGTLLSAIVWTLWGFVSRRRRSLHLGAHARGTFAAAAYGLLVLSALVLITCALAQARLAHHASSFMQAAADPVAWRQPDRSGT